MATITYTPEAAAAVEAMTMRVAQIAGLYGDDSPEHARAAASLARYLGRIAAGPDAHVSRDGHLSLLVRHTSGFTYGIVFFRDHDAAQRFLTAHGHPAPGQGEGESDTAGLYALYADVAGTWSAHS